MFINKLCTSCDGRGFHWVKGYIISRVDGSNIATTYKQGEICSDCGGSGQRKENVNLVGCLGCLGVFAAMAVVFVLAIVA